MNYIFISPNYPAGHWKYIAALRASGCNVLGIGDAGDETFPAELRGNLNEYCRVGDLHNYDDVYRTVAYYISRYGRPDVIESLNPYWEDTVDALRVDFSLCHCEICKSCYEENTAIRADYADGLLPVCRGAETVEEAVGFAGENGYPLLAIPLENKRLGRRLIASEAGLLALFSGDDCGRWLLSAQYSGDPVTVDGIMVHDSEQEAVPLAVSAHALNADGSLYSVPVSEELAARAVRLAETFCRDGFFHIDGVRLQRSVPGAGRKGDIVFNNIEAAPPHEFIVECMNVEFGCDLRRLWAQLAAGGSAEEERERLSEPVKPLEPVRLAGAVCRSFEQSYKNPHEKILRKLNIRLALHGLTADPDKFRFSDYYYIFSGATSAELKRSIKFITEDFAKCQ